MTNAILFMETISQKQFRVLRKAIINEKIYTADNCIGYLAAPILGKTIDSIKFKTLKINSVLQSLYAEIKESVFEEFSIHTDHVSQTMYVITKDKKIIYYTFSSIYAPASNAWHTLTELFWGGHNKQMSWIWNTVHDFKKVKCFVWSDGGHDVDVRKINQRKAKVEISKLSYHY